MKSKKLLTLIIVVVLLIVIIVVFASILAVRQALPVYHNFEGGQIATVDGAPTEEDILKLSKGKSILLLSKEDVLKQLNQNNTEWHAIGIVKNFPNILEVHFVKRVAIVKIDIGGKMVYLDSFGYVVKASEGVSPIDITSAIEYRDVKVNEEGKKFEFLLDDSNTRLECVLESIMALWQCKCEIENIPGILGKSDVFTFDSEGTMTVTTKVGAKIKFMQPTKILTDKIIKAFSVYCSDKFDLQKYGTEITVWPDGKVTTPEGKVITKV